MDFDRDGTQRTFEHGWNVEVLKKSKVTNWTYLLKDRKTGSEVV
jgi:hypothetical protein